MPPQRNSHEQTMSTACQVLGIWLDKHDVGPPPRKLPTCRHSVERLTVPREKSLVEKCICWGTKEGVLDQGKPHKGAARPLVCWVNASQINGEEKGIAGKGMWVWNCMLTFCKPQGAQYCQSLELWDSCQSGKSWSWTSWQRSKRWNVSRISYQTHSVRKNTDLRGKLSLLGKRWDDQHAHSGLPIPLLWA